jgi:hypothetical protein
MPAADGGAASGGEYCDLDGQWVEEGAFRIDCQNCTCRDGEVTECQPIPLCRASCENGGKTYLHGQIFPAGDRCNNCECWDGVTSCSSDDCSAFCRDIEAEYAENLDWAGSCDPDVENLACTVLVPERLGCECSTFVTPNAADAGWLSDIRETWELHRCAEDMPACEPCFEWSHGGCLGGRCVRFRIK